MKKKIILIIFLFSINRNLFSGISMNSPEEFYNYNRTVEKKDYVSSDTIDRQFGVFLIRLYQKFISPLINTNCQFEPSCSEYMKQAINKYGFLKGYIMGLERLIRCNSYAKKENYSVVESPRGKRLSDIPENNLLKQWGK